MSEGSDPIVVGPIRDWWATWTGDEYINIFASDEDAHAYARGENVAAKHALNTTGDDTGSTPDEREEYVRAELRRWASEEGAEFRANGWG